VIQFIRGKGNIQAEDVAIDFVSQNVQKKNGNEQAMKLTNQSQ
jgi:hypothetical protein